MRAKKRASKKSNTAKRSSKQKPGAEVFQRRKADLPKLTNKGRQLLTTADRLFMKHGIKRITVEEICTEAGVSKMTFYKFFKNKSAIARRVLEEIYEEAWIQAHDIFNQDLSFPEKLKQILLMKIEHSKRWSSEFIRDLMLGTDPGLRQFIHEENIHSIAQIRDMFTRAQEEGDLRPDMSVDFMMYMIGRFRKLFEDEQLHALFPDMAIMMQNVFNMFYYGVLADKHKHDDRF